MFYFGFIDLFVVLRFVFGFVLTFVLWVFWLVGLCELFVCGVDCVFWWFRVLCWRLIRVYCWLVLWWLTLVGFGLLLCSFTCIVIGVLCLRVYGFLVCSLGCCLLTVVLFVCELLVCLLFVFVIVLLVVLTLSLGLVCVLMLICCLGYVLYNGVVGYCDDIIWMGCFIV